MQYLIQLLISGLAIGAIYGFENLDDVHALVLELVEGGTLAERLDAGPLPIPDALANIPEAMAAQSVSALRIESLILK